MTMLRHSSLYLSMPMASTSSLDLMPGRAGVGGAPQARRRRRRSARLGAAGAQPPPLPRLAGARTELLVDFVLDGEAVAVPAEAAGDVVARGAGVAGHDILQRGCGRSITTTGRLARAAASMPAGCRITERRALR